MRMRGFLHAWAGDSGSLHWGQGYGDAAAHCLLPARLRVEIWELVLLLDAVRQQSMGAPACGMLLHFVDLLDRVTAVARVMRLTLGEEAEDEMY